MSSPRLDEDPFCFDFTDEFLAEFGFCTAGGIATTTVLEENARANPDARIRPLTHVSVDRAFQAESVGSNSLLSILIAIRRSPNL